MGDQGGGGGTYGSGGGLNAGNPKPLALGKGRGDTSLPGGQGAALLSDEILRLERRGRERGKRRGEGAGRF